MTAININSKTIALPAELASEIITTVQEESAVMKLARQIALPGNGLTIPVITGDPEAEWVNETEEKPVKRPGLDTKQMSAYTLAVIVPFSNQFRNNAPALYNEIVKRLPGALAKKFDSTIFGGTAPGSNFDTLTNATAQSLGSDPYAALVAADGDVADHDGITNGFVISPKMKSALLGAKDSTGRPLFINSVAEGAVPMILGAPTHQSKGAFKAGSPNQLGFAGDWTHAIYGVAQSLNLSISDQATLTDGETTINLWQRNMFAVRAEIEVGFVADVTKFNRITA